MHALSTCIILSYNDHSIKDETSLNYPYPTAVLYSNIEHDLHCSVEIPCRNAKTSKTFGKALTNSSRVINVTSPTQGSSP